MAKHDIVLLNTTSSGFETDLGNNVARIKGDADDLFSVRDGSGVDKFAVSSLDDAMIISGSLTLTGNLSVVYLQLLLLVELTLRILLVMALK